jgi:dTMP kinase
MYLNGEFGENPDDVNPYAASAFFAVDRYASYKTGWGAFLSSGGIVVADRYTMSNMIHQGAKFAEAEARKIAPLISTAPIGRYGVPNANQARLRGRKHRFSALAYRRFHLWWRYF